ncbi:hypothetical protein [Chryseobacterium sp. FH2]|uniref:hypothetical protein n=1 Tax=Chryseobacterium sp. FH2 TaxID=1674291 RepID=UPI001E6128A7|nr:hypothetical protein [Chryseobacterium sp. FH2]
MFLFTGTFIFANNANCSTTALNKISFEKLLKLNGVNIRSISYDDNGKCTVKASYHDTNGNHGTITVTSGTCAQAMANITIILGEGGL